jgi:ketosteroid isomerase-like protein
MALVLREEINLLDVDLGEVVLAYLDHLEAAGEDRVVAVLRISGRAKLSGVETDLTDAAVYTIRDGKIAVGREYATRDEALEAAGLRESVL